MTALPLLHRGTVHNVLHYLRDNQTLRWKGGGFMLFMDTPTRRTRRQNGPSSLRPWTTRESPGTYTRAGTSILLRVRIEVLQVFESTEIIQVFRTFRNRPYLSALLIRTTMCRVLISTPVSNAGVTYLNDQTISQHPIY